MFFVDSVAIAVVVIAFAVARWIVPVVVGDEPRTERFRKLFENFLTGLRMQSLGPCLDASVQRSTPSMTRSMFRTADFMTSSRN